MSYQSKYKGSEVEHILDNALLRTEQTLTEAEKQQVKENLGIEDLSNYPTKEEVTQEIEDKIAEIPEVDLSNYPTKTEVTEQIQDAVENTDTTYQSAIENKELEMPNAVGGLDKGTKVSELEGKTYSQMFDEVLFPTTYPTFTNPSATIKLNVANIQEVGSQAPTASDFTTSFNGGAITLDGVKVADRAGELDEVNSYVYCTSGDMPSAVGLGYTYFKYRAIYAEGIQPKDNKGNDYDSPLPGGYVDSAQVSLNGTYPWYIRDTKQTLVAWTTSMNTGNFTLEATGVAEQTFKLPRELTELQMLNTISGKMEVVSTDSYSLTNESINGITYYVYTYNGDARGEVTLLAKF